MRITFVLPFASLSGGIRVIATYARCLTDMGHEVWVVSHPKPEVPIAKKILYGATGRGHKTKGQRATPLLDFLGPRHVVLDQERPVQAADVPDADAIFATWWATASNVADLPASKGVKFYLLQDYEIFAPREKEKVIASYSLPLHKIAVSNYIKEQISENHGETDITVIPNAVDLQQFNGPRRPKNAQMVVGFLYNSHPRKRVELAIQAAQLAREQIPDLRAVAFGTVTSSQTESLPDWVDYHLAPKQSEIPDLYRQCDLWLFPSKAEGFGLPLLEAMACRTPVLATRAGAAPDLIDGTNGKIVTDTPEAIAGEIVSFSQMPDAQWQGFSQSAHQTANRYSWADATERLLETVRLQLGNNKINGT